MKTEYLIEDNSPIIFDNGKYIRGFEPYFYVYKDATVPRVSIIQKVLPTDRTSLDGKALKKIYTYIPVQVRDARNMFAWTGEADIRFTKRYNIDKGIVQKNEKLLLIDIETATPRGADIGAVGKHPVTLMTIFNTVDKTYRQLVQKGGLIRKDFNMKYKDRKTGELNLHIIAQFDKEKDFLRYAIAYIKHASPDMIVDYSIDGYDMNNLIARSKYHKINYKNLSPIHRVNPVSRDNPDIYDIAGVEVVPLIKYYKKWYPSELEQTDLHNICMKLFGIGKTEIISDYIEKYNTDLKGFLRYNIGDVELLRNFIKHTKIIDNINYITHGIGCEFEDYMSPTSMVKHFLLKKAIEKNVVLDTWVYDNLYSFVGYDPELFKYTGKDEKNKLPIAELVEHRKDFDRGVVRLKTAGKGRDKKLVEELNKLFNTNIFTIKGAYVLDPVRGVHDNVECFDWKSLYPSIMVAYNMSWETLVKYDDRKKYNKEDLFDVGNGVYFLKPHMKRGFLAQCIIDLFDLRYSVQDKMRELEKKGIEDSDEYKNLDTQQTVIKYQINAFYGVMELICIWIAESVTHVGRLMAKWTVNKAKELGYEVIYGDTDSIYAVNRSSPVSGKEFAKKLCSEFEHEWNMSIEIKHEGTFPRALFITKKRYALLQKNGKLKPRGIEIRRSDHSQFKKDLLERMIMMLLEHKDRKEIMQYLRDEINDIPNKKPTILAVTKRLNFERKNSKGKVSPNKIDKAAMKANNILSKNYMTGDKPYYLHDICFDYDHEIELTEDRIESVKEDVNHTLELYFNMLDWDIEELTTGYRQRRWDI